MASKSRLSMVCLAILSLASCAQPDPDGQADCLQFCAELDDDVTAASRVAEIVALGYEDQFIRTKAIERFQRVQPSEVLGHYQYYMERVFSEGDRLRTERLKAVMGDMSWEELADLDMSAFDAALLIVNHATHDLTFQRQVLDAIEPLAKEGRVNATQYVANFDKVYKAETGLQFYGSQYECVDGAYTPLPIEDADSVDERRADIGVVPLADYLAEVVDYYGPCPVEDSNP